MLYVEISFPLRRKLDLNAKILPFSLLENSFLPLVIKASKINGKYPPSRAVAQEESKVSVSL